MPINEELKLFGFQRYLMAKKTVDDRSLNKDVFHHFAKTLEMEGRQKIVEIGGGIGTMLQRLFETVPVFDLDYLLLDLEPQNLEVVYNILTAFAERNKLIIQKDNSEALLIRGDKQACRVQLLQGDLMELHNKNQEKFDGVIANAVLDLVNLETALPMLASVTKSDGWLYATINFDGKTVLEPMVNRELDDLIMNLYHQSMDIRKSGEQLSAGSKTGRKLFFALENSGYKIGAAGASDWFVFPQNGKYPADEAFFLNFILDFIQDSVGRSSQIDKKVFADWLHTRRQMIHQGKLVLITSQYDYFARKNQFGKI